jgi:uncharacterized protein YqeY
MSLSEQLQKDLVAAMKAKEELRLGAIRMIKTALQKANVVDPSKPLDEAAEQQLLKSLVKQRIDRRRDVPQGGPRRTGREGRRRAEDHRSLPAGRLPKKRSGSDVSAALAETGATSAKQMGLVMKAAQAKLAGKNRRRKNPQ